MAKVIPIFLFALPRTGSTLLQRMIATHPMVATDSEGWILLPLFYATKEETDKTEYCGWLAKNGLTEFLDRIPNGEIKYKKYIADIVTQLFSEMSHNNEKYYLEKTPRYHLIVNEIIESFPDAKIIFLWRNPLAMVSSILTTNNNNRWNLYNSTIDLYKGIDNLTRAFKKINTQAVAVNYESLVQNPESEMKRIMDYLNLSIKDADLESINDVSLTGSMGDKIGIKIYKTINTEPIEKWKRILNNPVRKLWCHRYLNWIGENRLSVMGYDLNRLKKELSDIHTVRSLMFSDMVRMSYGSIYRLFNLYTIGKNLKKSLQGKRIYPLS